MSLKTNFSLCLKPKIQVASKYERRVDTRSYDDKKKLFEGVSKNTYLFILILSRYTFTEGIQLKGTVYITLNNRFPNTNNILWTDIFLLILF